MVSAPEPPSMNVAAGNSSHVSPTPSRKKRPGIPFAGVRVPPDLGLAPAKMIGEAAGAMVESAELRVEVAISTTRDPDFLPLDLPEPTQLP